MALTIYENKEAGAARVKLDRRIYKDAAGKLVEEGDPSAAILYGSVGKEVPRAEFEALGGVVGVEAAEPAPVVEPEPEPAPKPKRKPKAKPKAKAKAKPTKKGK
jgi:hypothetical protein